MAILTWQHYLGALVGIVAVMGAGVLSGISSKKKGVSTSGERSLGTFMVSMSFIGVVTGGASTVGTAQLAYTYGFSAWWFTLGAGLASLTLCIVFRKPMFNTENRTLALFLRNEYGKSHSALSSVFMAAGSFLSLVSQTLSGVALIYAISPISELPAGIITVVVTIFYILFGGMRGSAVTGLVKCALLYSTCAACAVIVLTAPGGFASLYSALPADKYFNLLARGAAVDLGAGLSLILGIVTTQTYFQTLRMSKNIKVYRNACLISAVLIPPIGVACVLVGLYMRVRFPGINPASALPLFLTYHLPPVLAGFCIGAMLVTIVGAGAGLTVGIASNFSRDLYATFIRPNATEAQIKRFSDICIVVVPTVTLLALAGNLGSLILTWSFLALGLRGAAIFGPLCASVWLPGKVDPKFALAAIIAGPLFTFLAKLFLPLPIDPVFPGLFAALAIMAAGFFVNKSKVSAK